MNDVCRTHGNAQTVRNSCKNIIWNASSEKDTCEPSVSDPLTDYQLFGTLLHDVRTRGECSITSTFIRDAKRHDSSSTLL
jgi:hypothetical protein